MATDILERTKDPLANPQNKRAVIGAEPTPQHVRRASVRGHSLPYHEDSRAGLDRGTKQYQQRRAAAVEPIDSDADAITVQRAPLVHEVVTGESVKHNKRVKEGAFPGLEDRRQLETGLEVTIPGEVTHKFITFLTTYAGRWNYLATIDAPAGQPGTMYDYLLAQPEMEADKALLEKISVRITDNAREIASPDEIKEFLQSGNAWAETVMAMERFELV